MLGWLRRKHPGSSLASLLMYEFGYSLSTVVMACFRLRWTRSRNLPQEGAMLIVANHASYLDPTAVGCAVRHRQLEFLARAGLFTVPVFGRAIASVHAVPVKESGGDPASIKEILRRLEQGRAVLIFPEGSRSRDGSLGEFKRGVALILKRSKCPVLPVGISGAYDAWPRGGVPRLFKPAVTVAFGEPIPHDELLEGGADAALSRLRDEVATLIDEAATLRI